MAPPPTVSPSSDDRMAWLAGWWCTRRDPATSPLEVSSSSDGTEPALLLMMRGRPPPPSRLAPLRGTARVTLARRASVLLPRCGLGGGSVGLLPVLPSAASGPANAAGAEPPPASPPRSDMVLRRCCSDSTRSVRRRSMICGCPCPACERSSSSDTRREMSVASISRWSCAWRSEMNSCASVQGGRGV